MAEATAQSQYWKDLGKDTLSGLTGIGLEVLKSKVVKSDPVIVPADSTQGVPAGKVAPVVAADPGGAGQEDIDVFGVKVNKAALYVTGGVMIVIVTVALVRR